MMRVIDLFAGAGGFSLAAEQAGCWVSHAVEIDSWACATLRKNHNNTRVFENDIRLFNDSFIVNEFGIYPDIIIGGPPCQGFSHAGPSAKDPKDPRNSLFQEFIHFVKMLEPAIVILENVPGILRSKTSKGNPVVEVILQELRNLGYDSKYVVLDAHRYGVPQIRKRVFFLGSLIGPVPDTPEPTHAVETDVFTSHLPPALTVRDAIVDLPLVDVGSNGDLSYIVPPQTEFQRMMRADAPEIIQNHMPMRHSKRLIERFKQIRPGQSQSDVTEEHAPRRRMRSEDQGPGFYDQNNRRMHWDKPCHTLPASFYANFLHPELHRNFTPREGARLQSFPDRYIFEGKPTVVSSKLLAREGRFNERYLCQYNQIGNAVPPLLGQRLIEHVVSSLRAEGEVSSHYAKTK